MCQVCGEKSGYYPLCMKHSDMRKTGEVMKCENCGKWYITAMGCPRCAQTAGTRRNVKRDVVFVSDEGTAPLIEEMLGRAKDSVLIASPWMWGIDDIVQRLQRLKKERVEIGILTRRSGEKDIDHEETIAKIHEMGCRIETDDDLHAKTVLVDDKELYIGSANLVGTSMERNREAGIWTDNPDAVSDAKDYFADAFDTAFRRRLQK